MSGAQNLITEVISDLPAATVVKVGAALIAAGLGVVYRRLILAGTRNLSSILASHFRHHRRLSSIRLVAFNRDRNDYRDRYWRGQNRESISTFAASAQKELIIVSISLVTGVQFEQLASTLRGLTEKGVVVRVSLLNHKHADLINSVSKTLSLQAAELEAQITMSFRSLKNLRSSLSLDARKRFFLTCHRTLPFASAILIDPDEKRGLIQLETKPYRAGIDKSVGFTLLNGGRHHLYQTLVTSYRHLIEDAESIR